MNFSSIAYWRLTSAIYNFQPDAVYAPVLWSLTVPNVGGFNALLGRKIKPKPITASLILMFVMLAAAIALTISSGDIRNVMHIVVWVNFILIRFIRRETILSVTGKGVEYYFVQPKVCMKSMTLTYFVYDKIDFSYVDMANVKVKMGRFTTVFKIEFISNGKKYILKTNVRNKSNEIREQAINLNYLIEMISYWCKNVSLVK